jgi:hypothetical protein
MLDVVAWRGIFFSSMKKFFKILTLTKVKRLVFVKGLIRLS